jgi:HAD superfamily hydrolase (TIGR01509 family)
MSLTTPKLVCFDIGGVLIRIVGEPQEAFFRAGEKLPEHMPWEELWPQLLALYNSFELGEMNETQFFLECSELTTMDPEKIRNVWRHWLVEPFPGVTRIIEKAKQSGITTACLSNTNIFHWNIMTGDGKDALPLSRLDRHFTSFDLKLAKPNSEIFSYVENAAGVSANEILYFDDSQVHISAAHAQGWQAHLITPSELPAQQMERVFKGFTELKV